MNDFQETRRAIATLLQELTYGASPKSGFVLNPSDPGLLRALDRLSAAEASGIPAAHTSSVAAHVDHLLYGIGLLNRWAEGEEPFDTADYSPSWGRTTVTEDTWGTMRADLKAALNTWTSSLDRIALSDDERLTGSMASVVHLAYHLGAIRQLQPLTAGPPARP